MIRDYFRKADKVLEGAINLCQVIIDRQKDMYANERHNTYMGKIEDLVVKYDG